MSPTLCLLALSLLGCGPTLTPTTKILSLASTVSTLADTYSTQHLGDVCDRYHWRCWEENPLQRPFQSHGKVVAYSAAYGESVLREWMSNRMQRSNSRFVRFLSLVPRTVSIASHTQGYFHNAREERKVITFELRR